MKEKFSLIGLFLLRMSNRLLCFRHKIRHKLFIYEFDLFGFKLLLLCYLLIFSIFFQKRFLFTSHLCQFLFPLYLVVVLQNEFDIWGISLWSFCIFYVLTIIKWQIIYHIFMVDNLIILLIILNLMLSH